MKKQNVCCTACRRPAAYASIVCKQRAGTSRDTVHKQHAFTTVAILFFPQVRRTPQRHCTVDALKLWVASRRNRRGDCCDSSTASMAR